jgi:hypothetical protein
VNTYTVAWFSAGVSSAVATKLAIAEIDRVIYTHIDDQHPDTMRFVRDCEAWFGKPVDVWQSPLKSVENACRIAAYIRAAGGRGRACTLRLKRRVRQEWEQDNPGRHCYVWGMDASEKNRAGNLLRTMPQFDHRFPLIERGIGKAEAHEILRASGIKRPVMYELGYHNNNCIGCVSGGMGYWNKIRLDFPDVYAARARMERAIGFPVLSDGVWLDELDPAAGRRDGPICDDCGILCELMALPPSGGDGIVNAESHGLATEGRR